jgi:Na+/H+ antiporter NhaC
MAGSDFVPVIICWMFIAFLNRNIWGTLLLCFQSVFQWHRHLMQIYLTVAAALGGGVFGDHCSPISDTTIISSMASASDHIDHVKTQLPYALTAGAITAVLYLVLGVLPAKVSGCPVQFALKENLKRLPW